MSAANSKVFCQPRVVFELQFYSLRVAFLSADAHVFFGDDLILGCRLWDSPESGKMYPQTFPLEVKPWNHVQCEVKTSV